MNSIWNPEFGFHLEYDSHDKSDNLSNQGNDNQIWNNFFNKKVNYESEEDQMEEREDEVNNTSTKVKDTNTDEDAKSISTTLLCCKTQRDEKANIKDSKQKRDIYLQKNRESAKKCREKRKNEIVDLIKQNQILTNQINYIKQKRDLLCPKCKSIFGKSPLFLNQSANTNSSNYKFIVSTNTNANTNANSNDNNNDNTNANNNANNNDNANGNTNSILSQRINQANNSIKRFCLIGGAIAMLCIFSTMMSIQSNLFSASSSNYRIRNLSGQNKTDHKNSYYSFKTNSYRTDKPFSEGSYVSFGDYYSIKTKNSFLSKKYQLVNNGKMKVIKDTTIAQTNMTECDNCVVEISEQYQIRKENDMHKFTLLVPLTPINDQLTEQNEMFIFYQVDCMAVGFQKNEYYP